MTRNYVGSKLQILACCAIPIILVACTLFWYYPSLNYPFEFDDLSNIVKYFKIRHLTFKDLFFANSRWISYWLNTFYYRILAEGHKFDPYAYRLGNVLIHCWAGCAVFGATFHIMRIGIQPLVIRAGILIPLLTTGLFLLHPVQTQTVSYVIQGQLEGMAGAFIMTMLALLLTLGSVTSTCVRAPIIGVLLVLAALSCGSKEIIIVAPILLLLADWFFVARGSWHNMRTRWWLYLLLFCIIIGLYLYLLKPLYFWNILSCSMELPSNIGNMLTESRLQKITVSNFCMSQGKVILHYLWIFIWPFAMSVDYDWKLCPYFLSGECLLPFILLAALGMYVFRRLKRNPTDLISFCVLWFFIAILPRSSIIPSTELLADYKTYTGSFGICLLEAALIAGVLFWLAGKRWWRGGMITVYILASLLLTGVGYATYCRNLVWESPAAFWSDVIRHAPRRARAYNNYGVALCEAGDQEGAIKNFKYAISLDNYYADPYNNLSVAYTALHKFPEAIEAMRKGIRIMPSQPEGYNNLASILINTGNDDEAEKLLLQALKLRPHYGKAYFNLGKWYLKRKRDEEAWSAFKACCMIADFDNEQGFTMYGHASLMLHKFEDAVYAYGRALAMQPDNLELAVRRALAAEQLGRYAEVDVWFNNMTAIHPSNIALWMQYGDILMQRPGMAHTEKALTVYERANGLAASAIIMCKITRALIKLGKKDQARAMVHTLQGAQLPPDLQHEVTQLAAQLKK